MKLCTRLPSKNYVSSSRLGTEHAKKHRKYVFLNKSFMYKSYIRETFPPPPIYCIQIPDQPIIQTPDQMQLLISPHPYNHLQSREPPQTISRHLGLASGHCLRPWPRVKSSSGMGRGEYNLKKIDILGEVARMAWSNRTK